jgi:crotonobetainyl-CoA:carnitine CoA-transferase CaiB-like acyl-CoA transferase
MAPVLGDAQVRRENSEIIDPYIEKLCQRYTKAELYEEGQRRHIAVSPINTPEDFILSPQTVAREFFVPVHHPEIGDYRHLGPIHKFSETPGSIYRTAPLIGEHNQEIYCGELGLSKKQLVDLKAVGVV